MVVVKHISEAREFIQFCLGQVSSPVMTYVLGKEGTEEVVDNTMRRVFNVSNSNLEKTLSQERSARQSRVGFYMSPEDRKRLKKMYGEDKPKKNSLDGMFLSKQRQGLGQRNKNYPVSKDLYVESPKGVVKGTAEDKANLQKVIQSLDQGAFPGPKGSTPEQPKLDSGTLAKSVNSGTESLSSSWDRLADIKAILAAAGVKSPRPEGVTERTKVKEGEEFTSPVFSMLPSKEELLSRIVPVTRFEELILWGDVDVNSVSRLNAGLRMKAEMELCKQRGIWDGIDVSLGGFKDVLNAIPDPKAKAICEDYLKGMSISGVLKKHRITDKTLKKCIKNQGIPNRSVPAWEFMSEAQCRLYETYCFAAYKKDIHDVFGLKYGTHSRVWKDIPKIHEKWGKEKPENY